MVGVVGCAWGGVEVCVWCVVLGCGFSDDKYVILVPSKCKFLFDVLYKLIKISVMVINLFFVVITTRHPSIQC